ncbi:MAG: hypothetical protein ACRDTD_13510 [Pseudonocardiaceae bacterium]
MSTLGELLDELTEQLGPPDEGMVAEAVEELTALLPLPQLGVRLPVR